MRVTMYDGMTQGGKIQINCRVENNSNWRCERSVEQNEGTIGWVLGNILISWRDFS